MSKHGGGVHKKSILKKLKTLETDDHNSRPKQSSVQSSGSAGGVGDTAGRMIKPKKSIVSPRSSSEKNVSTAVAHHQPEKSNKPHNNLEQDKEKQSESPYLEKPQLQKLKGGASGKGGGKSSKDSDEGGRRLSPKDIKATKKIAPGLEKTREDLLRHKTNLQASLQQLDTLLNKDLNVKTMKGDEKDKRNSGSANKTGTTTGSGARTSDEKHHATTGTRKTKEAMEREEALERLQYAEEDADTEQIQAKIRQEEEEKLHAWIDKAIQRVLYNTAILVLVAALLTACACYIFVQLPFAVYSYHILHEVFLVRDSLMAHNGFSRGFGLHTLTPLPAVIIVMYGVILYFIFLVQYPKQEKCRIYLRYFVFILLELYLFMGTLSGIVNLGNVPGRLDVFYRHDMKGMEMDLDDLHKFQKKQFNFLQRSQEYFGCCGYRDRSEWKKAFPVEYADTYPLSCCDPQHSGIACFGPVKETVTYLKRNDEDDDEPDAIVEHKLWRLYNETCFEMEEAVSMTVISLITLLDVTFITLSVQNYTTTKL